MFLGALLAAGCSNSPPSYPEPENTAEAKKEIEAHDKAVDDQEKARDKAAS